MTSIKPVTGKREQRYYFTTEDLVIIALFSSVGGVTSSFVGYIGNLINSLFGVPFGLGQLVAGLHIFWISLAYISTNKKIGTPALVGIVKGFVELFTGSSHGLFILIISGAQGIVFELTMLFFLSNKKISLLLAAGFSSISNVFIQQLIYFNNEVALEFILFISFLGFVSGLFFGGYLALEIAGIFSEAGVLILTNNQVRRFTVPELNFMRIISFCLIVVFLLGSLAYIFAYYKPDLDVYSISIEGQVEHPYTFRYSDFKEEYETTVEAELKGDVTYIPPKNYTGVPLIIIINQAQPLDPTNYELEIVARDGYSKTINASTINSNPGIIVVMNDDGLSLVASGLHGSYWVKQIARFIIS